jgi:hypothetical protein
MPNPMDAAVAEPAPVVEPAAGIVEPVVSDPFSLDEGKLASLSPEQRAALDPVFEEWKGKAKAEIEKTGKTVAEKYKPQEEKAKALEQLVADPRFQQWWRGVQQAGIAQNPAAIGAIATARPQDFATNEEWQNAMAEAYAGDPTKMKELQARMYTIMATPIITQLKQGQEELRATLEMKDLFERHADAKELDLIGRDPADKTDSSESLLESCLEWADKNGKTFEEGYARARKWADALKVGAQKQAMGLVQDKKASVTSGPSTNVPGSAVVEVADAEELMDKNMEYLASGQKPPRFVIRRTEPATSGNRWSNRT